tara:strand:- start:1298 stop:1864 length:567 start_codon:yes stop_codon:yes gene_type:complete
MRKNVTFVQHHRFVNGPALTEEQLLEVDSNACYSEIDEAILAKIGGLGLPLAQMAAMLGERGISVARMQHLYSRVLNKTRAHLNANISQTIYEKAMAGDAAMLSLWAKTQMGWAETTKRTLSMEETTASNAPKKIVRTFVGGSAAKEKAKDIIMEEAMADVVEEVVEVEQTPKSKKEAWFDKLRNKNT